MKKRILQGVVLAFATFAMVSFDTVKGWIPTGSNPQNYEMGEDAKINKEGVGFNTIKSRANVAGFGALMHTIDAKTFQGKRIKVTGLIKSSDVLEWGGIWVSVNQSSSESVSLDNMKVSRITGTKDAFTHVSIVVDVPANSKGIAYGSLLKGSGKISTGRVSFDIVDKSVPLTK